MVNCLNTISPTKLNQCHYFGWAYKDLQSKQKGGKEYWLTPQGFVRLCWRIHNQHIYQHKMVISIAINQNDFLLCHYMWVHSCHFVFFTNNNVPYISPKSTDILSTQGFILDTYHYLHHGNWTGCLNLAMQMTQSNHVVLITK